MPSSTLISVHVSRRKLALIGLLLLLPWVLLALLFATGHLGGGAPPAANAPAGPSAHNFQVSTDGQTIACKPGPWGDLYYTRILIEPPEEQVVANFPKVDHVTWFFKGYDGAKFNALWTKAALAPAELAVVNDPGRWTIEGEVAKFAAPEGFVLGLNESARTAIYSALSYFPENGAQNEPYRFRADQEADWFANSGLQPETIRAVRKYFYHRGTSVLFSDQAFVLPRIASLDERTRLIKTLARKSTMLVTLRVYPDSNLDALDNYWGRGSRSKDIKPFLQSLPKRPEGVAIDIVHLLPRSLVYTFPSPSDAGSRTYIDCHWTVLNFFNAVPDPRYQDINEVTAAFHNNFHPVTGQPTLGDIYLLVKPNGDVIHSCVYIADDLVFTKNGASPSSPWLFMTLADVVAFYPSDQPLDVQRYRAKDAFIGN